MSPCVIHESEGILYVKPIQKFARKIFLAATSIAIFVVLFDILEEPIATYFRVATAIMLAVSAWLLFGDLAVRHGDGKRLAHTRERRSKRLNVPMLAAGATSMLLALVIMFTQADYLIRTSSLGVTLTEYALAVLFCGGFALTAWAILRPIGNHRR